MIRYKIVAYINPGTGIDVLTEGSWNVSDGIKPAMAIPQPDAVPDGYFHETNIGRWDKFRHLFENLSDDFVREQIRIQFVDVGGVFAGLLESDKQVVAKWGLVDKDDAVTVTSEDALSDFAEETHKESFREWRKKARKILSVVRCQMARVDTQTITQAMIANRMLEKLMFYGIWTSAIGGIEGIEDWAQSRAGTSYEGAGLQELILDGSSMSAPDLRDKIISILER